MGSCPDTDINPKLVYNTTVASPLITTLWINVSIWAVAQTLLLIPLFYIFRQTARTVH